MSEIPCSTPCGDTARCFRVSHEGQTYRCARALSETLGCTVHAIYKALNRTGSTDCVGRVRGKPNHRRAISFGPHHWPSITDMARDLGVERSGLNRMINHDPDRVLALVMLKKSA